MANKSKRKTRPRKPDNVRANLERFPWDNPYVIAGLCRVVDIVLAKTVEEDSGSTPAATKEQSHNTAKGHN